MSQAQIIPDSGKFRHNLNASLAPKNQKTLMIKSPLICQAQPSQTDVTILILHKRKLRLAYSLGGWGVANKLKSVVNASAMASSPGEPSDFPHFLDDEFLSHKDIVVSHFQGCSFSFVSLFSFYHSRNTRDLLNFLVSISVCMVYAF